MSSNFAIANEVPSTFFLAEIADAVELVDWVSEEVRFTEPLVPGVAHISEPVTLSVRSNVNWSLYIVTDNGANTFREYDNHQGAYSFGGEELNNPVSFSVDAGSWYELSDAPIPVRSGMPRTGEASCDVVFRIRIEPSWNDRALSGDREYRLGIQYILSAVY